MTNASYPRSRVLPGAMKRLLTEDWGSMTQAARSSDNSVSNLARWERIVREQNPRLNDSQVTRLAEMMRTQHYQSMARRSGEARRRRAT